jgi:hypothetical protein
VAAIKAIRASRTAYCIGSLVAPSNTIPLTVRMKALSFRPVQMCNGLLKTHEAREKGVKAIRAQGR